MPSLYGDFWAWSIFIESLFLNAQKFWPLKFPPPGDSCRSQCKSFLERGASTAFEDIKVALSNATLLNYPQHDIPTALFVDASDKFCGAVLSQIDGSGTHRPLEYFSDAFSDAQKRYSTGVGNLLRLDGHI